MNPDSFRTALRAGLPWQTVGFGLMAVAVAIPAVLSFDALAKLVESWGILGIARWIGVLGGVLFVVGAWLCARGRRGGLISAGLVFAALLWTGEFAMRLISLGSGAASGSMLAARVGLGCLGSLAFSSGMLFILPGTTHRAVRAGWRSARLAFALQLAVFVAVPLIGLAAGSAVSAWLDSAAAVPGAVKALLWLAFAAPYVWFWVCLRRTVQVLSGRETIADVLLR